jgi:hypothetical protein
MSTVKTKKKSVKSKPKAFTKKELDAAIADQSLSLVHLVIYGSLLELYEKRPDDFKKLIGEDYINDWLHADPYQEIQNFVELCNDIANSITGRVKRIDNKHPILLRNDSHAFIGLTKDKSKATNIDTLLDFIELVDHSGIGHATITLIEEGKL